MVSMAMLLNNATSSTQTTKTQTKNVITVKNSQNKLAISNPLVLKPVSLVNGSTNISNIQSHIKIGNNVFAIIQKANPTPTPKTTLSVTTKPQTVTQTSNNTKLETNTLKICQPGVEPGKTSSFLDHDYTEEEDFIETTGVSKVSLHFVDICVAIIPLKWHLRRKLRLLRPPPFERAGLHPVETKRGSLVPKKSVA